MVGSWMAKFLNSSPLDRDFWDPRAQTLALRSLQGLRPYQRTVQWMRFFAFAAWQDDHPEDKIETLKVQTTLSNLTAHSCRVTLLDAAVHAGRSTEEIGLQANWERIPVH